jgi:hypothetical protein
VKTVAQRFSDPPVGTADASLELFAYPLLHGSSAYSDNSAELRAGAQAVSCPGFSPGVRFVVDRVAVNQVFFQYFGFLCRLSLNLLVHTHHRTWLVQ